ncbi:hypothetical protein SRABI05_00342 [Agrobacterium fabrum]|nr:hypothetical protein SRABI05_00342 [Agrobacterium fabrum]CAH0162445.1 hypothetical protein SRABI46_01056 [Agrobacterium fabrum]
MLQPRHWWLLHWSGQRSRFARTTIVGVAIRREPTPATATRTTTERLTAACVVIAARRPGRVDGEKRRGTNMSAFKIRVWAVVGPHNSGKTSVIGALTSQKSGRGYARDILLRGHGWLYMHAFSRSVQEANRTEELSIHKIEAAAAASHARHPIAFYNVLLALRSDQHRGLNPGHKYLAAYASAGWELQSIILLEDEDEYKNYARMGVPTAIIANTVSDTANPASRNWVFGAARNHFGWA